jgi:hypothetical protein
MRALISLALLVGCSEDLCGNPGTECVPCELPHGCSPQCANVDLSMAGGRCRVQLTDSVTQDSQYLIVDGVAGVCESYELGHPEIPGDDVFGWFECTVILEEHE